MESTFLATQVETFKREYDDTIAMANSYQRQAQSDDNNDAVNKVIDLRAQAAEIRSQIGSSEAALKKAEEKEETDKQVQEDHVARQKEEQKLKESSKTELSFLDEPDSKKDFKSVYAGAQQTNPQLASAQIIGKTQDSALDDDKHETKSTTSSGQAST